MLPSKLLIPGIGFIDVGACFELDMNEG